MKLRLFQPLYGSHQSGCSTNKQVLQISPATVSHFSFIYNVFIYFFCVCVLKKYVFDQSALWQADDGPLIVVFGTLFLPSSNYKKNVGPPLTKLSGSVHAEHSITKFHIVLSFQSAYLPEKISELPLICITNFS